MSDINSTVEFRDIPNFPGYRVGSDGSVWSCWIHCRWGTRLGDRWKQLNPGTHHRGYLYVNLTVPGEQYKTHRVHRLVLVAFVGECPAGMECRHLNGCKTDCRLENLAWGTPEENRQDNHEMGAYQNGEDHTQAKLTAAIVRVIRARYVAGELQRQLSEEYSVSASQISNIVNRKSWKHLE